MPPRLAAAFRDPLVHFVLAGAALFAIDRAGRPRAPARPDAAPSIAAAGPIAVTDETRRRLAEEHTGAYGRPPTAGEMDALVARWIDEEVLYREGLARGLERDDPRIRHLVAQKMTFVLEQALVLPAPTDAEVGAWFEAHAEKWARPPLVDFTQVFVSGAGADAEARARALLAQVESGADPAGLGDTFSGGRRYRRRTTRDLGESFGPEFTSGLDQQREGTWALRRSRFGLHIVRVDRRTPAARPALAEVRAEVEEDIRRARRAEKLSAAVAALRARWPVDAGARDGGAAE
jgi:hypothetical protein